GMQVPAQKHQVPGQLQRHRVRHLQCARLPNGFLGQLGDDALPVIVPSAGSNLAEPRMQEPLQVLDAAPATWIQKFLLQADDDLGQRRIRPKSYGEVLKIHTSNYITEDDGTSGNKVRHYELAHAYNRSNPREPELTRLRGHRADRYT